MEGSTGRAYLSDTTVDLTNPHYRNTVILWTVAAQLFLSSCGGKDPTGNNPSVTDFSLEDLNSNSSTYRQIIGPSTYEGSVSGYYFGDQG